MKKLAKILAVVLTMALMLTGITLISSAADEAFEATTADGTTVTYHNDFAEALSAAGVGGTVKLLKNFDATEDISIAPVEAVEPEPAPEEPGTEPTEPDTEPEPVNESEGESEEPAVVVPNVTIDLNGFTMHMKAYALRVSGGSTVTIKNGHFKKNNINDTLSYALFTDGENTVTNFVNVTVTMDCPLSSTTNGATFNVKGSYNNAQWTSRRRNFYVMDATVDIENVNINAQYNPPIVVDSGTGSTLNLKDSRIVTGNSMMSFGTGAHTINIEGSVLYAGYTESNGFLTSGSHYQMMMTGIGYDDRITITGSEVISISDLITMTSGAEYTADNALAEGEYNIKVVDSLLSVLSPTKNIIKTTPYITEKKDSNYLFWSKDGTTGYHWEVVTAFTDAEGNEITAQEWLDAATDVEVTQDSRKEALTQTLKDRKEVDGVYYELIPELPYRHTELYFENSHLISETKPIHSTTFLTTRLDDGTTVIRNQPYYQSERHSMLDMEFVGCLVETKNEAYEAYSSHTILRNTVTVFSGVDAKPGSGIFSNGRFASYDSAFIYPTQEATANGNALTYFRMFNSGSSRQNFWLVNTYISDYSSPAGNHGYSNSLSLYGNTGVVIDINDKAPDFAKIEATVKAINERFEKNITLPTQSKFFVQDFENVVNFGGDMNWIIPGVKVVGATAELTDALTLTVGEGENALFFGHYNTNYNIANIHGSAAADQYKNNYYQKLGYANKATAFDDLSLIGLYVIDFDVTATDALALSLVAEDGSITGTVNLPSAKDGVHFTLVVKVDENRAHLYVDGHHYTEANGILGEATVLLGAKLTITDGTVNVDNLEINHYAKDYTDADELFAGVFTPDLDAWEEGFARVPVAPAPPVIEEPTDVVVRWYLTATDYIEKTFKSNEQFVLTEEDLQGKDIVRETEKYFTSDGVEAEVPYYVDEKGMIAWKSTSTHPAFVDRAYDLKKTVLSWKRMETNPEGFTGVAYEPEYVGGIASVTAPDGTVTYYDDFRALTAAVNAITAPGYHVTILSDIMMPTESGIETVFNVKANMSFDLNGKKLYCIANNKTKANDQSKVTVILANANNVVVDVYSSKPGAEIVNQAATFMIGYNLDGVTYNISSYGDADNTQRGYGISVQSAVFYSSNARHYKDNYGDNILNVVGAHIVRLGDYRAVFIFDASYDHKARVKDSFIHAADSLVKSGSDGMPVDTGSKLSNDLTFDNCVINVQRMFNYASLLNLTFNNCSFTRQTQINTVSAAATTVSADSDTTYKHSYSTWEFKFSKVTVDATDATKGTVVVTMPSDTTETLSATLKDGVWKAAWPTNPATYITFNHCSAVGITNQMNNFYDQVEFTDEATSFELTETIYLTGTSHSIPFAESSEDTPNMDNKANYPKQTALNINFTAGEYFDLSNVAASTRKFRDVTWTVGTTTKTLKLPVGATAKAPADMLALLPSNQAFSMDNFVVEEGNGTIIVEPVYILNFELQHNFTVSDSFVYNVYLPTDCGMATATLGGVTYTLDANAKTVTLADGKTYFVLSYEILPQNLGQSLELVLTCTEFEKTVTLSPLGYVEDLIADENEKSSNLGKAIVAYAKATCDAFEANPTAVDGYAEICALVAANPIGVNIPEGEVKTNLSDIKEYITGAALKLDGTMKFRFYLAAKDTNASFTYTFGGETVTYTTQQGLLVNEAGDRYYVELEINAYEFAQDITITSGGVTVTYNLMTYANSEAGAGNGTLLRAIANLAVAAKNYKAAE